jgi:hypothetical protein
LQVQETFKKVVALFDFGSQTKFIEDDLVNKLGLEVHDHPRPYPLGWVNNNENIKFTKQCKIKFTISVYFIDKVEVDVVLLTCVV